jgi:hypothetical protein
MIRVKFSHKGIFPIPDLPGLFLAKVTSLQYLSDYVLIHQKKNHISFEILVQLFECWQRI